MEETRNFAVWIRKLIALLKVSTNGTMELVQSWFMELNLDRAPHKTKAVVYNERRQVSQISIQVLLTHTKWVNLGITLNKNMTWTNLYLIWKIIVSVSFVV